jgi:hypothetical protein
MKALLFTEKMCVALAAIGVALKFTSRSGGGLLIVLSLSTLACIYFLGNQLLFRDRHTRVMVRGLSALGGMAAALTVIGILFRLQYWPGSGGQLMMGLVASAVVTAWALLRRQRENGGEKDRYLHGMVNRFLVTLAFGAILFSVPQSALIRLEYRHDPKHAELMVNFLSDPENKAKWEALARYEMGYAP